RGKISSFQDPNTSALDFTTLLSPDSIRGFEGGRKKITSPACKPTIRRSTAAGDLAPRRARRLALAQLFDPERRALLLTIVGDVSGGVDLANHFPMFLESNGNEL